MKDIKRALSEYTVPMDGDEWKQIAADQRLVRFNKEQRLKRYAIYGGAGLGVASLLVGIILYLAPFHSKDSTTPSPTPIQQEAGSPATISQTEVMQSTPANTPIAEPVHGAPIVTEYLSPIDVDTEAPHVDITQEPSMELVTSPVVASITPMSPSIASPTLPSATESNPKVSTTPKMTDEAESAKSSSEPLKEPIESQYQLFIPNSFTPDGNGTNDLFMPKADFTVQNYEINIFSRNGLRVFTSRSIEQGWDGYNHGTLLPAGAYMYVIRYTDPDGLDKTIKGQVILLK